MREGTIPRVDAICDRICGGRVLNVGCVGQNLTHTDDSWLHGRLDAVADGLVGIDIDAEGIDELRRHGWDARVDDAHTLSTVTKSVNVVVAGELIEHLDSPGRFLGAVRDILGPGGKLLLTTPNPWAVVYLRRVLTGKDPVGNDEHTCWFDATTLRELVTRHSFEGEIIHLPPQASGLSSFVYRHNEKLGGTRLLANLRVDL